MTNGSDSYVFVLSSAQMGIYHEQNYTYQYDIIYSDASATDRYIALVSDYNGQRYNSFHFRNKGTANNQAHYDGSWLTYDVSGNNYAASTDSNSIVTKLLGKSYSSSAYAFKNISVSIRYVVDWKNGNSVYMRVNTVGYPGTGKWILVSKSSPAANGASMFDHDKFGAAIVLKTGGKQNGYIDNIIIWTGTGDEPTDKTSALLTSKNTQCSGHRYVGSGICSDPKYCIYCGDNGGVEAAHDYEAVAGTSDSICTRCKTYKSNNDSSWLLKTVPAFDGGTRASALYQSGHGWMDATFSKGNESYMIIVSKTTPELFNSYRAKLVTYGYTEVYSYTCDGNIYSQLKKGSQLIYTYYTASCKEVRIIDDKASETTNNEFGYTYEKKDGDTTILYQYGVPMNEEGVNIKNNNEKKIDCGMMYVIKLADNSVFIMDGGGYQQFDAAQIDGFMAFLRNVTGTKEGEKIRIAAWYMSHGHPDHMAGFCLFVKKYHKELSFERIFYNFPSPNSPTEILADGRGTYSKLLTYIDKYVKDDNFVFIKPHTGQEFKLADITVNVFYTHEDIVNPTTALSEVANDYNNSSAVLKITIDGKIFMLYGDVNKPAMNVILANNSDASLKCDIVQLAHHVINDLSTIYHKNKAPVVLVPQSPNGCTRNQTRKNAINAAKTYVQNDMLYYASEETVGLQVIDGKITEVFTAPVHGGPYADWGW